MPKSNLSTAADAAVATAPMADTPPASYEAAMAELEGLIDQLESGQVPIDALVQGHQRAQTLLAFCRSKLQAVESVLVVSGLDADGTPKLRALDDAELRPSAGARE